MLKLQLNSGCWEISFGNGITLSHSRTMPFVSIIHRGLQKITNEGKTVWQSVETQRIPLRNMKAEGLDTLIFSNGDYRLTVRFRENASGVDLVFQGEENLQYEFNLPSIPGETVFGGGAQEVLALNNVELTGQDRKIAPVFMTDQCRLMIFGAEELKYAHFDEKKYCFAFDSCPRGAAILKGNSYEQLSRIINERMPLQKLYLSGENGSYSLKECFSLAFSGIPAPVLSEPELYGSFFRYQKQEEQIHRLEIACFSLNIGISCAEADAKDKRLNKYIALLSHIHEKLSPYLQHCREEALLGLPQIRPDFWESVKYSTSKDPRSYYLGNDLFVCPNTERSARRRSVFLPEGEWNLLWSGKPYAGSASYTVDARPGRCPVFWRKGSRFEELFRTFAADEACRP